MKKIGVCACYNTKNYGSMLQTLATGKILQNLGYDYEFIRYSRKPTLGLILRSIDRIPEKVRTKIRTINKKKKLSNYPEVAQGIEHRNKCFDSFMNQTFTSMSPCYDTITELRKAASNYAVVLVGSDQLWRPEGYSTGFYNLMFVPENVPKIAYATSFGVSQIPESKKKIAKQFLSRIDYIGVRELRASEMIKELIGREVPTVVDPTLLFSGKEWNDIIIPKNIINEKYIFCYLLGSNPQHRVWVNELKKRTGCKIVTIPFLDEFVEADISFGDYQIFNAGPAEFVNLIRKAEFVCTDSFHGSVFSILNHKKFVTFNRFSDESKNSRNSRIESILKQTGLQSRRMTKEDQKIDEVIMEKIDYEQVEDKLVVMRETSLNYLKNALHSIS
ncbi:MAG: polysaccharide pyruvyl transferase family protein [Gallintestinimicrobium sp.]|uniref:polysaccharide pyruvyl transferase family protein n=1 Tax=Gallintestinimicrobium sp. TaxID=2981655 RepID=UPI0039941097